MSTIDNLIDLKDEAVSLAYEVKAAVGAVGETTEHFNLPGDTARALLRHAESVVELQGFHDQANEAELSEDGADALLMAAVPDIPARGGHA